MEDGNLENINFLNQSEEDIIIDLNNPEIFTVIDDDGNRLEFEKICIINVENENYSYLVYTDNILDKNGEVSIFISKEVINDDGTSVLYKVEKKDADFIKSNLISFCKGGEINGKVY